MIASCHIPYLPMNSNKFIAVAYLLLIHIPTFCHYNLRVYAFNVFVPNNNAKILPKLTSKSTTNTTPEIDNTHQDRQNPTIIKLEPLAINPLIFSSAKPILTPLECQTLKQWCRDVVLQYNGKLPQEALDFGIEHHEEGALLMIRLQRMLEEDLLGHYYATDAADDTDNTNNTGGTFESNENGYVLPRFISYHYNDDDCNDSTNDSDGNDGAGSIDYNDLSALIPDGLHVDTNNSKHFRHWSILFYFDTCDSLGATTFPLAIPYKDESSINSSITATSGLDRTTSKATSSGFIDAMNNMKRGSNLIYKPNKIQNVAKHLIEKEDVQHTRMADANESQLELGKIIDEAAKDLIHRDKHILTSSLTSTSSTTVDEEDKHNMRMGIRILPKQGHFCLFSSLNTNGYPNPLSFHGGEAMDVGESKEVLTFFYEIRMDTFTNREEFGQRVAQRERDFLNLHFGGLESM